MPPELAVAVFGACGGMLASFAAGMVWARRAGGCAPVVTPAAQPYAPASAARALVDDRARACVEAEAAERQRIAAQLHDELQPLIAAARLQLELPDGVPEATDALREASSLVRSLAHELGDPDVEQGLDAGLSRACATARTRLQMDVVLRVPDGPLPGVDPVTHSLLLMSVRELLHNAHRHAPGSTVQVQVERGQRWLLVGVEDNGPGFGVGTGPGLGLRGMRRRIEALGGELDAGSASTGGARVTLCLPLRSDLPRPGAAGRASGVSTDPTPEHSGS